MKEHLNGGMMDADKDQLITEDTDAAYRKCPGVNNVAYVVSRAGGRKTSVWSFSLSICEDTSEKNADTMEI